MTDRIWTESLGVGPVVATAIHDGHHVRESVLRQLALDDLERLREEDPFTGGWSSVAPTRVIGLRSRFEVDLNRAREKAVYRVPEDAWGLKVWSDELAAEDYEESLAEYDLFYQNLRQVLDAKVLECGRFVILDIHTYNHRRDGADAEPADSKANPQVNVGTGTLKERQQWAPLIDRFISDLGAYDFPGSALDVRENVKFFGGNLARWTHENYPDSGCVLSVEFKKFFMDEWSGEPDPKLVDAIGGALGWTASGLVESLRALPKEPVA
jgi:N-formylglutamate deformylase